MSLSSRHVLSFSAAEVQRRKRYGGRFLALNSYFSSSSLLRPATTKSEWANRRTKIATS
jgi:hypothetical protein